MDEKLIVLAGATGNLGGRIARALLQRGAGVIALVRVGCAPSKIEELRTLGATIAEVDFSHLGAVTSACSGASCVVSALSGLREVIVDSQTLLLDAALKAGVRRFIPSDYCIDFTKLPPGTNRNLDWRREFRERVDRAELAATSILNGAFAEMLTGQAPIILFKWKRVLYWADADQRMDFTTIDDTAAFTAAAALDSSAPRFLRIAGEQISARELVAAASEVTGETFRLFRAGGLGRLQTVIKVARTVSPGITALYPAWQGMQYLDAPAQRVRGCRPHQRPTGPPRIVFATAHEDASIASAAAALGASGVVRKREMLTELVPAVRRALLFHAVCFYEDTRSLAGTVALFIGEGLAASQAAVIVATASHGAYIRGQLTAIGVDYQERIEQGALLMFDADEVLNRLMVGTRPDALRFEDTINPIVDKAAGSSKRLARIYGEMVDVLWSNGREDAALSLEILWHPFIAGRIHGSTAHGQDDRGSGPQHLPPVQWTNRQGIRAARHDGIDAANWRLAAVAPWRITQCSSMCVRGAIGSSDRRLNREAPRAVYPGGIYAENTSSPDTSRAEPSGERAGALHLFRGGPRARAAAARYGAESAERLVAG